MNCKNRSRLSYSLEIKSHNVFWRCAITNCEFVVAPLPGLVLQTYLRSAHNMIIGDVTGVTATPAAMASAG